MPSVLAAVLLVCLSLAPEALGKVLVTVDQAVKEAFPGAATEKRTDYLTETQASRVAVLAGTPPASRIVLSYRAAKEGRFLGTAYLETHLVRTLPETILVVVDPAGRIVKVEILSFDEPPEYMPKERWLDQFRGRPLDPELSLRGAIRGITGATLSSRAIAAAVRRVLAAHQVLAEATRPAPSSAPSPSVPSSVPAPSPSPLPSAPPAPEHGPKAPSRPSPGPSGESSTPPPGEQTPWRPGPVNAEEEGATPR